MKYPARISALLALLCLSIGCTPPADNGGGTETDSNVTAIEQTAPVEELSLTEGLTLAKIEVPSMACAEGCPPLVKSTLSRCEGVDQVIVDFETKTASLAVAADAFDGEAAVNSLSEMGFENAVVKNE